ncbi:hypothetical protein Q8A73_008488, partial [Channa argus]
FYAVAVERPNSKDSLKSRKRREWVLPARYLKEDTDFSHLEYIAKIQSDFEYEANILYSLEGIGANQYPFHMFVVDPRTGFIRVTQKLDREFIDTAMFQSGESKREREYELSRGKECAIYCLVIDRGLSDLK